jgi:hypothetical protein
MMSEHTEQVALFSILALYEGKYPELRWIHAIPNGGKRHVATAVKMKAEGVKAGVWDVFVPVAVDDKCGCYIEMKYGSNKFTSKQVQFQHEVGDAYEWYCCYSAIEAAHAIGEYLGISELMEVE